MRYIAEIDGKSYTIDVDDDALSTTVQLDGRSVTVDLQQVTAPSLYSLIRDGRSFEVFAEPVEKGYGIVLVGERFVVSVADERSLRLARVQKRDVQRRGDLLVKAPMPGLVMDVHVAAGDTITAGQSLVTLMAMKMENDIRAFEGGVISALNVQRGDKVNVGDVLMAIG